MGWLYSERIPPSVPDEIARICSGDDGARRIAPLAMARVGTTWYVAVEARFASLDRAQSCAWAKQFTVSDEGAYVFGAVILTDISGTGWGYKDMDETMGPVQSEAPEPILSRLSPTTAPYALAWRERCRAMPPRAPDEVWLRRPSVPALTAS